MQDFVVYLIVLAAAVYLGRVLWRAARGESGCNACSLRCGKGAPAGSTPPPPKLVQIDVNGVSKKSNHPGGKSPH